MTNKSPSVQANHEFFWAQLLDFIESGSVIPIVGEGLLQVRPDGEGPTSLHAWLARRLADKLGLPEESSPEELAGGLALNEVACRYLRAGGKRLDIYSALNLLLPEIQALDIPRALQQLAEIGPLQLFVTTTFDPLLERALKGARGGKDPEVHEFSPEGPVDLPSSAVPGTTLFYLFGRLAPEPSYAVTEEDVLEFVHALQSQGRRPENLLDRMTQSHLLILGSRFDDWLARFFLRSATRARLSLAPGIDYLADQKALADPSLVRFLETFSDRLKLFREGDAVQLVDRLHRLWTDKHPSPAKAAKPAPEIRPYAESPPVFLSYASEDLETARRLRDALDAVGVDTWFDKDYLQWGDQWEEKIERAIRGCQHFLPLLSRNTVGVEDRYFLAEWNLARQKAQRYSPRSNFLLPLWLDDVPRDHPDIPLEFTDAQYRELSTDADLDALALEVRDLVRGHQRQRLRVAV